MPLGEGWWIDLTTGQAIPVDEHAYAVLQNPTRYRLDPKLVKGKMPSAPTAKDTMELRRLAMKNGFVRVRAHGASVVVEFDYPKLEDVVAILVPFLTNQFGPHTWVAFHDVTRNKQYADVTVQNLEDPDFVNQLFGLVFEHKSIKLSMLYEDYDETPVGSKDYATGTEKLVRGPKFGAGPGVKAPPHGDISRISDVGSEPYSKDTVKPSEKSRIGQKKS